MSAESIAKAKALLAKHASSDFGGLKIVPEFIAQEAVEAAGKVPDCIELELGEKLTLLMGEKYAKGYNDCLKELAAKGIIKLTK